jgi:CHAT domain-containing protein
VEKLDNKQIASMRLEKLNRLPDTAEEVKDMALALGAQPDIDTFTGERATERQVKTMDLSDRRVIAFASHALLPWDLDGLDQPAIALSSPTITGGDEDGLLTMSEIMKLRLNADWVVLSACNTGASEGEGAEAVSGLGRAFFYAGTRAVLVTMWPVETTSAKSLMTGLFSHYTKEKGLSRAQAQRRAINEVIDSQSLRDNATGKTVASYAHPFFWAPYIIMGDGG